MFKITTITRQLSSMIPEPLENWFDGLIPAEKGHAVVFVAVLFVVVVVVVASVIPRQQ